MQLAVEREGVVMKRLTGRCPTLDWSLKGLFYKRSTVVKVKSQNFQVWIQDFRDRAVGAVVELKHTKQLFGDSLQTVEETITGISQTF